MDNQMIFNIAYGLISALGGWVLNNLKSSIDDLHSADRELTTKVQAMEVLVAGSYVKRDDLDKLVSALFEKLEKISDKLDAKADKP